VIAEPSLNAALLQQFEAEWARRELVAFCERMDPRYERARHSDTLVEHLEALERGDIRRLAVFMPPRHSKTYHTSERFPAWAIGRDPRRQIILASYAAELAERNSRIARNLLTDERWPFPHARLAADSSAVNRWTTTAGGTVIAAGVGGAMTGFGAHILAIDDPVKGREEADSELMRERAWEWYTEVARTRLMPGGRIVLCQTRWHEDDLAGRILNSQGGAEWTVLDMPALSADGSALWPAWFDVRALAEIRQDIGARSWSALYQQAPTPDEGGLFKRAWFQKTYTLPPDLVLRCLAVDSAFKTGIANDYSVLATWATNGHRFYPLDVWRRRVEYPDLKAEIIAKAVEVKPHAILIEDTAAGQSIIQELQRTTPLPVVAVKVTASKEARAAAASAYVQAGKVVVPAYEPWVEEWIEEHVAFPSGRHDDQVDTTSIALPWLAETVAQMVAAPPRRRALVMG
jgi:predicted phage terminase large subunit-like protein